MPLCTVQRGLPVTLVGAGLPQLPELAGEAKSYAERLFRFSLVGSLPGPDAQKALVDPATEVGVKYEAEAVEAIIDYTEGYPYFLQEYGFIVWDLATDPTITVEEVARAQELVEAKLDDGFFKVRAGRTTDLELQYMRAMAELGSRALVATGDVIVNPRSRTAPCAVRGLCRFQASPERGDSKCIGGELVARQRGERHESGGARDGRHDELVEVVEYRAGKELAKRSDVAFVGAPQSGEIAVTVAFVNDRRWESEANEQEVQDQPAGTAVAVKEWMDLLKARVQRRERLGNGRLVCLAQRLCFGDPVADQC